MIAAAATPDVTAVVTWNTLVSEILAMPGTTKVFDSSQIPMEITDMTLVKPRRSRKIPSSARRWWARGTRPWP